MWQWKVQEAEARWPWQVQIVMFPFLGEGKGRNFVPPFLCSLSAGKPSYWQPLSGNLPWGRGKPFWDLENKVGGSSSIRFKVNEVLYTHQQGLAKAQPCSLRGAWYAWIALSLFAQCGDQVCRIRKHSAVFPKVSVSYLLAVIKYNILSSQIDFRAGKKYLRIDSVILFL